MRVVIQRVRKAKVSVGDKVLGQINEGVIILVAVEDRDNEEDIEWLTNKIISLRIFDDKDHIMNLNIKEVKEEILVVSQFTLFASTKKGNRPSYSKASKPEVAIPLYENFVNTLELELGKKVQTGVFGADMKVALVNDGPVTIMLEK